MLRNIQTAGGQGSSVTLGQPSGTTNGIPVNICRCGDSLPERDFPMLVDAYLQGRLSLECSITERIDRVVTSSTFSLWSNNNPLWFDSDAMFLPTVRYGGQARRRRTSSIRYPEPLSWRLLHTPEGKNRVQTPSRSSPGSCRQSNLLAWRGNTATGRPGPIEHHVPLVA